MVVYRKHQICKWLSIKFCSIDLIIFFESMKMLTNIFEPFKFQSMPGKITLNQSLIIQVSRRIFFSASVASLYIGRYVQVKPWVNDEPRSLMTCRMWPIRKLMGPFAHSSFITKPLISHSTTKSWGPSSNANCIALHNPRACTLTWSFPVSILAHIAQIQWHPLSLSRQWSKNPNPKIAISATKRLFVNLGTKGLFSVFSGLVCLRWWSIVF